MQNPQHGVLRPDTDELEIGSKPAVSVRYLQNRLSDAHASLVAAEQEIRRLIHEADF